MEEIVRYYGRDIPQTANPCRREAVLYIYTRNFWVRKTSFGNLGRAAILSRTLKQDYAKSPLHNFRRFSDTFVMQDFEVN